MVSVASTDVIRFWSHVNTTGGPNACWPMDVNMTPVSTGYVHVRIGGRQQLGHRLALAWSQGLDAPPRGKHADHLCHDPDTCPASTPSECLHRRCVNPRHLAWKSARENNARSGSPSARNIGKDRCPQDHPYDDENTYVTPRGQRVCRTCAREANRRWIARGGERTALPPAVCPTCGLIKPGRSFRKGVCGACDQAARRARRAGG